MTRMKMDSLFPSIGASRPFVPFVISCALAMACGGGTMSPDVTPATAGPLATGAPTVPAATPAPPTAVSLPTATAAPAVDISGSYRVAGINFDRSDYRGRAQITGSG